MSVLMQKATEEPQGLQTAIDGCRRMMRIVAEIVAIGRKIIRIKTVQARMKFAVPTRKSPQVRQIIADGSGRERMLTKIGFETRQESFNGRVGMAQPVRAIILIAARSGVSIYTACCCRVGV